MLPARLRLTALAAMALIASAGLASPQHGVDARISTQVTRMIANHQEYSKVRFQVEDAVVTLEGAVRLESERRVLIRSVKGLSDVAAVRSNVLLDPPAVADDVLFPRVRQGLESLHLPQLRVSVHEGLVTVSGSVASNRERQAVLSAIRATDGVKEVTSHIRVEGATP